MINYKIGYLRKNSRILLFLVLLILTLFLFIGNASAQDTSNPEAVLSPVSDIDHVITEKGRETAYKLNLRNQGSQPESFFVTIDSNYDDWGVSVDPPTGIRLNPEESKVISLIFQIPNVLDEKDYMFNVTVKSRNVPAGQRTVHVIVTSENVIITAALKPVLVIRPSIDNLGKLSPGTRVEVELEVKIYVVSAEVYLDYEVLKNIGSKLVQENDITIKIEPEYKYITKSESGTFKITVSFPKNFNKRVNYNCQLQVTAKTYDYEDSITRSKKITFVMVHNPPEGNLFTMLTSSPIAIVGITSIVMVSIIGGAITSTEVGKYKFLLIFFIPLYTKLHKDKILDHFTRGRVYEYIRNNPGAHYSELKRELDLNNGTLTYHLHTLEREALIKAQNIGRYKLFYPTGVKIPKDMEPQISAIRQEILEIIRLEPGISQKELGLKLGDRSQRTVSYHVKNMEREGILRLEHDGRERRCYLNVEVLDAGESKNLDAKAEDDGYDEKYLDKDSFLRQI